MKTCKNCGKNNDANATFCSFCGKRLDETNSSTTNSTWNNQSTYNSQSTNPYSVKKDYYRANKKSYGNDGLGTAAKVFLILAIVSNVLCILALIILYAVLGAAYSQTYPSSEGDLLAILIVNFIPALISLIVSLVIDIVITTVVFNKIKNGQPISTGIKVCVLLFASLISGILLLCRD